MVGSYFDSNIETDARRTRWLESQRFRVLRFSNNDIRTNLEGVCDALLAGRSRPPPENG
jgi:very-short-patch-repair endonuclease